MRAVHNQPITLNYGWLAALVSGVILLIVLGLYIFLLWTIKPMGSAGDIESTDIQVQSSKLSGFLSLALFLPVWGF